MHEAKITFDRMHQRNVVSWNTLLGGVFLQADSSLAQTLFERMPEHDVVSWNGLLTAYAQIGEVDRAMLLLRGMPQRNVVSWNVIITGLSRSGLVEKAQEFFQQMPSRDLVAWNAAIAAYGWNGQMSEAEMMFSRMPDRDLRSWTSMIAIYSQHGHLEQARKLFQDTPGRSVPAWNSMIAAYAKSGQGNSAIELFHLMQLDGVDADSVTFVNLLTACSHQGLVERCRQYFVSMQADYKLLPVKDHLCTMVDILGRAGQLVKAVELASSMPELGDAATWGAFLGACHIHKDVEHAHSLLSNTAFPLGPEETGVYTLITNLYKLEPSSLVRV